VGKTFGGPKKGILFRKQENVMKPDCEDPQSRERQATQNEGVESKLFERRLRGKGSVRIPVDAIFSGKKTSPDSEIVQALKCVLVKLLPSNIETILEWKSSVARGILFTKEEKATTKEEGGKRKELFSLITRQILRRSKREMIIFKSRRIEKTGIRFSD